MSELHRLYAQFEDRFRGSREQIIERLEVYTPFLTDLEQRLSPPLHAIDYGCGRGEWLQLLTGRGWKATGVDLNSSMLREAKARGLHVERGDLAHHLSGLAADSAELISAIHVVEHISHDALLVFVREAMRVLKPEGLLILETPNPENLAVSTSNFYLDPTHIRPIPPPLLHFMVEQAGFGGCYIVRLNGERDEGQNLTLEHVIRPMFARALDYAIVATKGSDPERHAALETLVVQVSQQHPVDLGALHAVSEDLRASVPAVRQVEANILSLREANERSIASVNQRIESLQGQLATLRHSAAVERDRLTEMTAVIKAASQTIALMRASRSWRITQPLRAAGAAVRQGRAASARHARIAAVASIDRLLLFAAPKLNNVARRPKLQRLLQWMGARWPRMRDLVLNHMRTLGLRPESTSPQPHDHAGDRVPVGVDHMLNRLPPRSRSMYLTLQEDLATEQASKRIHAAAD